MNLTPSNLDTEPTLAEWFSILIRGWKILFLTTLVGGTAGFLMSRWKQDVFQCDALVQIETDEGGAYRSFGELDDVFGTASKAETEIEIIRSRMVLLPVVHTLDLTYHADPTSRVDRLRGRQGRVQLSNLELPPPRSPKEKPWRLVGRDSSTLILVAPGGDSISQVVVGQPLELPIQGDTVRIQVEWHDTRPGEEFVLGTSRDLNIAQSLYGNLSVSERGKKTGILYLNYRDRFPDRASAILNEILHSYMRQNIDAKSAEAQKTLGFLKEQLPGVKVRLDSADAALNNYRRSRGTVDLSAEAQLSLNRQVELGQQLLELQQRKQELSRLYKEDHPQLAALNQQIGRLHGAIGSSSGKVKKLPQTQQEVLRLTRDVTVATEFYQTMLDKIQQLEVVRAGEVGSARILDSAQTTYSPIGPDRNRILLVGLLGGFFLGFAFLLVRKALDKGVRDSAILERITGASVFAQVPRSASEEKSLHRRPRQILAASAPDDLAVESLRSLRTALEFSLGGTDGRVLGITGLTPGVGKSFVSVNLAALFAANGRKTILVDADLRKGRLHTHFDERRNPGLSELLSGAIQLESAARPHSSIANLWFLPTGKLPPNPSEMLGSPRLKELLQTLRGVYDLVIVDTSPILLVTDPTLVMRHVDHVTAILEYGKHGAADIHEAMALLKVRPDLGTSLVLNKCDDGMGVYGRYGRYGSYSASPSERD